MKIYHKRSFYNALIFFVLTLFMAGQAVLGKQEWTGSHIVQLIWFSCFGLYNLYCAMNKKKAKELTIQDSDEMLVMERLKSYRAAFWTTDVILLLVSSAALHFFDTPVSQTVSIVAVLTAAGMTIIYLFFLGSQSLQHE